MIGSHIIPKFYLDQFSVTSDRKRKKGPANLVWVYQKNKQPVQRATVRQGAENGYFTFKRADGKRDESFEARLAALEADCGDTLLLTASPFFDLRSASRRSKLAFYVGLLFNRATQRRRQTEKNYKTVWDEFKEAIADEEFIVDLAAHYSLKLQRHVSTEQTKMILTRLAESVKRDPAAMRNSFIEELLWHVDQVKEMLLKQKAWQVWHAPSDIEFVTSDNPVVTFLPLPNGAWNPGWGFNKPGVVTAFPLAPNACLIIGSNGPESVNAGADQVRNVNEIVIRLCDKFVYSKTYSEEVQKLVDVYGGSARYGETAFVMLGRPTAKEFIRRVLGLESAIAHPVSHI